MQAARQLINSGFPDVRASRAYYAAFYAATTLVLSEGSSFSKHSGVIAFVHRCFVKTGRVGTEQGKALSWLFELRGVGDYGGTVHVTQEEAERAAASAEGFVRSVRTLVRS